jgi:hypothetical protein
VGWPTRRGSLGRPCRCRPQRAHGHAAVADDVLDEVGAERLVLDAHEPEAGVLGVPGPKLVLVVGLLHADPLTGMEEEHDVAGVRSHTENTVQSADVLTEPAMSTVAKR